MDAPESPAATASETPAGVPAPTPRRRFSLRRFTLRTLLVLVTLIACALGFVKYQVSQIEGEWHAEQQVLEYLRDTESIAYYRIAIAPTEREWLRRLWRDKQIFDRVRGIQVATHFNYDEQLVARLRELRQLDIVHVDCCLPANALDTLDLVTHGSGTIRRSERDRLHVAAQAEVQRARPQKLKLESAVTRAFPTCEVRVRFDTTMAEFLIKKFPASRRYVTDHCTLQSWRQRFPSAE